MSFLAPLMLLGTLTASIPIVLHLFYRSRYRKVPWAAMEFLRKSIEQTSRRLKFQELLLLILRVAVLFLLALALARPFTRTVAASDGSVKGDAVDAVFVVDTSYSMAAEDGPLTRLDRARNAALAVIDHLPRDSTVQIISSADRAVALGPRTPSNLGQARQILQDLKTTHLATDHLPGVNEAAEALRLGQAPNKEVYLFSDMQTRGFEMQAAALAEKLRTLSQQATVYLVRCGTRLPKNVAVVGIAPQSGIPHTGERVGFAVLVRNSGREPVRDTVVSLEVDGRTQEKDSQTIPILGPGETKVITLTGKLDKAGLRVITARLGQDELTADNRFDQVVDVREQVRTLVIDGSANEKEPEKSATFFLMHSLRPVAEPAWGKYHIQPRMVAPRQASPALLADKEVCILANVGLGSRSGIDESGTLSQEFLDRLADFVRAGHGLLIFGGSNVKPEDYNRLLGDRHALLPAKLSGVFTAPPDKPLHIDPATADARGFLAGFREEPLDRVSQVEIDKFLTVEKPDDSARVVLKYSDGLPAVLSRKFGDGEVVLVTTSADPTWTNWPILPTYLPFTHVVLSHLLHEQTQTHNHTAGEPLRWHPLTRESTKSFTLLRPGGEQVRLGTPDTSHGRPALVFDDTATAGVYELAAAQDLDTNDSLAKETEAPTIPFAVVPDVRESENLETLTDGQLDERLGFIPVHLTAGDDPGVFAGSERLNWEWTKWLLVILLFFVLGESLLAWLCGRAW